MSRPRASLEVDADATARISVTVNGRLTSIEVAPRLLLSDLLRHELELTGTHVGCEHGVCGCCTVLFDGRPVRSCLMLAIQADGHELQTVESLADEDGSLHPLQEAFRRHHGLQCGFCTPGQLMNALPWYRSAPEMSDTEIREALSGQLCRCTGYAGIVAALRAAAAIEAERADGS
jgi:aerobic-type carbon monoxide dehydrogenase small subunit (CoxS/CutS family)